MKNKTNYVCLELFSGSGKVSRSLNEIGLKTYSFDIRLRKGKCVPDFRVDILKISAADIFKMIGNKKVFAIWVGLPCDVWSYASGGFHLDSNFNPKTEKAKKHLALFNKTIKLLNDIGPIYYYIENPRGLLRYYPKMIDFLVKSTGITKQLTLSSYGFCTTKPTNIFTNDLSIIFKELDAYGRGAKCNQVFNNITKHSRQSYPVEFALFVANHIYIKYLDHKY